MSDLGVVSIILSSGWFARTILLILLGFSIVTFLQSVRITQERDKAEQVSEFFMDLFLQADPSKTRGESLTVREALDRGAGKIGELEAQPEVQAAYMNTIGEVYGSLGLFDEAAELLEEALRQRRRVHGGRHREARPFAPGDGSRRPGTRAQSSPTADHGAPAIG